MIAVYISATFLITLVLFLATSRPGPGLASASLRRSRISESRAVEV